MKFLNFLDKVAFYRVEILKLPSRKSSFEVLRRFESFPIEFFLILKWILYSNFVVEVSDYGPEPESIRKLEIDPEPGLYAFQDFVRQKSRDDEKMK